MSLPSKPIAKKLPTTIWIGQSILGLVTLVLLATLLWYVSFYNQPADTMSLFLLEPALMLGAYITNATDSGRTYEEVAQEFRELIWRFKLPDRWQKWNGRILTVGVFAERLELGQVSFGF